MAGAAYQRLTQLDNAFLVYENESAAMHVASTQILEAEPLRASDGSIDIDRITDYVVSRLDRIPALPAATAPDADRAASGLGRRSPFQRPLSRPPHRAPQTW